MTAPPDLRLAADFPSATRDSWRELVAAVLRRSAATGSAGSAEITADESVERALSTPTYDGFDIQPLYTAEDDAGLAPTGAPGASPFVRGSTAAGATVIGWDVRQWHRDPDPVRLNQALLTDLENGATSAWLQLGDAGLPVDGLARALNGVYLDLAPLALDAGADTAVAAEELLAILADRQIPADQAIGTLGADPIGLFASTGHPAELTLLAGLAGQVQDYPNLLIATVDGTIYHNAGGSASDELAITASVGVAYLRMLVGCGLSIDEALARIEFRFAVTAEQFPSIAKLRAARQLWARIAELSGADVAARGQRQHAVTSAAMLTQRDPWVNMLRSTIACFAAAVGGAGAITVLPFDSALGLSDDFSRRIARNTSAVLHDESSLARVIDPAGGSWYVENLTARLAERAWDRFTALEADGGALAALQSGSLDAMLAGARTARRQAIAERRDALTGVSEFALISEPPVLRDPAPPERTGGPLPRIRYAADFEKLRDRSDAHVALTGERPKVLLAALGSIATYSGRSGFAANLFQAAGIEPVLLPIADPQAPELAGDYQVACLCSSDRVYGESAAVAAERLHAAGVERVLLAGAPGERADRDSAAGISGYVFVGCDAIAILTQTLDDLGVAP
ncbi:MAG: Methylmalonyl-CoA mutase [Frankiales bacterium]|nr:Methylmalonyl-CoA mutase [Frankiales bacterium]